MSRAALSYRDGGASSDGYVGFDPDTPVPGFYRMRLRSGGVYVGVRIWHGLPLDVDEFLQTKSVWCELSEDVQDPFVMKI